MEFHGTKNMPITLTRAVPWNSMELAVSQFRWHEQLHGIAWNSIELEVRQFRWHEQIYGIPWNLECANFDDTSSSMEFRGTGNAPISMTRAVPWNSKELGVRQFHWHEQFHGIPWNWECANFDDTSNSMEFHGTWGAPISLTRAVPWNSMELGVRQFHWHEQFRGIPWNLECANFADRSSSMEFHWTRSALISMTCAVPWNSIEFHRIKNAPISMTRAVPRNSMEFEGRQFCWHEQFHGIPWNLECAKFADRSSLIEFYGIPWNLDCANFDDTSSSMEFRGTGNAPISMTRAVS